MTMSKDPRAQHFQKLIKVLTYIIYKLMPEDEFTVDFDGINDKVDIDVKYNQVTKKIEVKKKDMEHIHNDDNGDEVEVTETEDEVEVSVPRHTDKDVKVVIEDDREVTDNDGHTVVDEDGHAVVA